MTFVRLLLMGRTSRIVKAVGEDDDEGYDSDVGGGGRRSPEAPLLATSVQGGGRDGGSRSGGRGGGNDDQAFLQAFEARARSQEGFEKPVLSANSGGGAIGTGVSARKPGSLVSAYQAVPVRFSSPPLGARSPEPAPAGVSPGSEDDFFFAETEEQFETVKSRQAGIFFATCVAFHKEDVDCAPHVIYCLFVVEKTRAVNISQTFLTFCYITYILAFTNTFK